MELEFSERVCLGVAKKAWQLSYSVHLGGFIGSTHYNLWNPSVTPKEYKEKWEAVQRLEKESNAGSQPTLK